MTSQNVCIEIDLLLISCNHLFLIWSSLIIGGYALNQLLQIIFLLLNISLSTKGYLSLSRFMWTLPMLLLNHTITITTHIWKIVFYKLIASLACNCYVESIIHSNSLWYRWYTTILRKVWCSGFDGAIWLCVALVYWLRVDIIFYYIRLLLKPLPMSLLLYSHWRLMWNYFQVIIM